MTPTITQSDRQMAADCAVAMGLPFTADEIAAGEADNSTLVQTLALARIAGWNAAVEAAANIAENFGYTRPQPPSFNSFDNRQTNQPFIATEIRNLRPDQEGKDDE